MLHFFSHMPPGDETWGPRFFHQQAWLFSMSSGREFGFGASQWEPAGNLWTLPGWGTAFPSLSQTAPSDGGLASPLVLRPVSSSSAGSQPRGASAVKPKSESASRLGLWGVEGLFKILTAVKVEHGQAQNAAESRLVKLLQRLCPTLFFLGLFLPPTHHFSFLFPKNAFTDCSGFSEVIDDISNYSFSLKPCNFPDTFTLASKGMV